MSDKHSLKMELDYSLGHNNVKVKIDFLIYKEHGALDDLNDA